MNNLRRDCSKIEETGLECGATASPTHVFVPLGRD
jgi:hypothetical protein